MRNSRPMSWALLMLIPGGARRTTSSRDGKRSRYVRFEKPRPNWRSSGEPSRPSTRSRNQAASAATSKLDSGRTGVGWSRGSGMISGSLHRGDQPSVAEMAGRVEAAETPAVSGEIELGDRAVVERPGEVEHALLVAHAQG